MHTDKKTHVNVNRFKNFITTVTKALQLKIFSTEKSGSALLISKKHIYLLILIILVAFGLRIARCFMVDRYDNDGVLYITMADRFSEGNIKEGCLLRPEIPALFPYIVSLVSRITGSNTEFIGIAVNIFMGTLAVFAIFLIANLCFKPEITLLITAFSAVNPVFVDNSTGIMREQTTFCLILFSLYFIFKGIKADNIKVIYWFSSGILSALAAFIRADGIEILPVFFIWIIVRFIFFRDERKKVIRKIIPGFLITLISFSIIAFPFQCYFNKNGSIYTVIPNTKTLKIYLGI